MPPSMLHQSDAAAAFARHTRDGTIASLSHIFAAEVKALSAELYNLTKDQFFAGNTHIVAGARGLYVSDKSNVSAHHGVNRMHAGANDTQIQTPNINNTQIQTLNINNTHIQKSAPNTPSNTSQQSTQTPNMVVVCRSPASSFIGSMRSRGSMVGLNEVDAGSDVDASDRFVLVCSFKTHICIDADASGMYLYVHVCSCMFMYVHVCSFM